MSFDEARYRTAVLDPAPRGGGLPQVDLLTRYGFDTAPSNEAEFTAQIARVTAYWKSLKGGQRRYAKIATALLAAHAELTHADKVTAKAFGAERAERTAAAGALLAKRIDAIAAAQPAVGAATVRHLAEQSGGTVAEADVRKLFTDRRITVVDSPWELPTGPPPPKLRDLRTQLGVLGLALSVDVVVGAERRRDGFRARDGFRLGTERLTAEQITNKRRELDGRARNDSKTATDTVLSILAEALRQPGGLDELVRWELVELLRPSVAADLPPRVLAGEAAALGLDSAEADALALALRERGGPAAATRVDELAAALAAGELRRASRLARSLAPDEGPELRDRVVADEARVTELVAAADRMRAGGRDEEAAAALAGAVRLAGDDDDVAERLRQIAPPPPTEVAARLEGGRVRVQWRPGPSRVGHVRFSVVRTVGRPAASPAAGTVVAETEQYDVVDPAAPPATPLCYTVFATRDGSMWSAAATTDPVHVLPDVADLAAEVQPDSVSLTWTLPRGARDVEVARTAAGGRQQQLRAAAPGGVVDDTARSGVAYRYTVRAVYLGDGGERRLAAGVSVLATPEAAPAPVTRLEVELVADRDPATARIRWSDPPGGIVQIRRSDQPAELERGAVLRLDQLDQLDRLGAVVGGAPRPAGPGEHTLDAQVGPGRHYFTAVTVGAGRAVLGAAASLAPVAPARELAAERRGRTVRLRWVWPPGATTARITWVAPDEPDRTAGRAECDRRRYAEDGGCEVDVGAATVRVSVQLVAEYAGSESVGVPASVTVAGAPARVTYAFRASRRLGRGARTTLVLTAERACRLPEILVVHRPGVVQPLRADQGTTIHTVPAQDLRPATPLQVPLDVPATRGPHWLGCFAAGDGSGVVLVRAPGGSG